MVDQLTTRDKVKAYLNITDSSYDARIDALLDPASQIIEDYLNRKIVQQAHTLETYDGSGNKKLWLNHYPINSVTLVKSVDPMTDEDLQTFADPEDYVIHKDLEYLIKWGVWAKGVNKYVITYNAGYNPVPPAVELAANMLIGHQVNTAGMQGIKSHKIGTFSQSFWGSGNSDINAGSAMPDEVTNVLAPWRKPPG